MGMVVNGFIEPVTRTLPMEYAVEWSRLIELQMEGSRRLTPSVRSSARCGQMRRADAPGLQELREPHLRRTARPSGSATSTSRPTRRGAARSTASGTSARLADVGWTHGTLVDAADARRAAGPRRRLGRRGARRGRGHPQRGRPGDPGRGRGRAGRPQAGVAHLPPHERRQPDRRELHYAVVEFVRDRRSTRRRARLGLTDPHPAGCRRASLPPRPTADEEIWRYSRIDELDLDALPPGGTDHHGRPAPTAAGGRSPTSPHRRRPRRVRRAQRGLRRRRRHRASPPGTVVRRADRRHPRPLGRRHRRVPPPRRRRRRRQRGHRRRAVRCPTTASTPCVVPVA